MMMMKRWRALGRFHPFPLPRAKRASAGALSRPALANPLSYMSANQVDRRQWLATRSMVNTVELPKLHYPISTAHTSYWDAAGQSHPAASMPCAPLRPRRPAAGRRRGARSQLGPPGTGETANKNLYFLWSPHNSLSLQCVVLLLYYSTPVGKII